ncbi:MAG TPA: ATP synthase F1 subunit gamma [Gemmatales bacterium]|nr:ATP synthase F1 subunit gamma [Gemmatales bacterium]HMP61020.1 ATP synthase F1 subunit gamma [Gemmatales bacterium]
MAKLRELVNRRKAVRNIAKITRTMELIATARFKKALDRAIEADAFTRKIAELAADLSASATTITHPLMSSRAEVKSSVLLVIAGNRGLCGGYNGGIMRVAVHRLRELAEQPGLTTHLELSGKRAMQFFRYQGYTAEHTYTQFEDKPQFDGVDPIATRYIEGFIAGRYDRVEVAYQKFLSASRQTPVVETLLPLASHQVETRKPGQVEATPSQNVEYEYLPDAASILAEILPVAFKVRLFKCFLDAAVSEQIARRVAMKAATDNANDLIKSISQSYNRARQAQITKELAEIIGGAAAVE